MSSGKVPSAESAAFTVTWVAPSPSRNAEGSGDRLMVGAASSSMRVRTASFTARPLALPARPMVSSPSTRVSWVGASVKLPEPLVWPPAMVISKSGTAL